MLLINWWLTGRPQRPYCEISTVSSDDGLLVVFSEAVAMTTVTVCSKQIFVDIFLRGQKISKMTDLYLSTDICQQHASRTPAVFPCELRRYHVNSQCVFNAAICVSSTLSTWAAAGSSFFALGNLQSKFW